MTRRIPLVVAVGIWILVAWYWVAWPAISYLHMRDVLGSFSSWDTWRELIVGPLNNDSVPPNASTYQYLLLYGTWLFGYGLLALALSTIGRLFTDNKANRNHKISYLVLLPVVLVFLVFGSGKSQTPFSLDENNVEMTEEPSTTTDESSSSSTTEVVKEWSYGFSGVQDKMLSAVKSGAMVLLAHREEYAAYKRWAEWGESAAISFREGSSYILELLIQLDDERRPDSYKDYFAREMKALDDELQTFIRYAADLTACARTSRADGDCEEELGQLIRSADAAVNAAIVR